MRKVTEAEFTAAMEAAVAERGEDYVYPKDNPDFWHPHDKTCVYQTPTGEPACLIGLAMDKLGLDTPGYIETEETAYMMMNTHHEAEFPDNVKRAAEAAQYAQDRENTWGEALEMYRQKLRAA